MAVKQKGTPSKPAKKGGHSLLKGPKHSGVKKAKGVKLTSVKNQIRGLQRLLGKEALEQNMRRSLESKMSQLQQSLIKHKQEETEKKFAARYHKVRFFERVKVERQINKLEGKQLRGHALSSDEQQQLQSAKLDLQYVLHFPKGERYVSILKEASDPDAQAQLLAERERLRKLVKHQLAEAALLAEPDEGLVNKVQMAQSTVHREADPFFLEEEPEEATEADQVVQGQDPELAFAVSASPRTQADPNSSLKGLHQAPAVSQEQRQRLASSQQQQQQSHSKRHLEQPVAVSQQQQQQRKRHKQSEAVAKQHPQVTTNGSRPKLDNVAAHHTAGHHKPASQAGHVNGSLRPAAWGKIDSVSTQEAHVSKAAQAGHQAGQHPVLPKIAQHPGPSDKTSMTSLTAAEKSRRLLQQLQQKFMKPVRTTLQPAQLSASKGRHQPPEALVAVSNLKHPPTANQLTMPLHEQRHQPRTLPIVVKQAKQTIASQGSALHNQHPAGPGALRYMPSTALPESAPHRTRAEGGRRRRK